MAYYFSVIEVIEIIHEINQHDTPSSRIFEFPSTEISITYMPFHSID
ncbi:MAG: hypothetical protein ACEY3J_02110 [Arsenophonus sp.]